MTSAPNTTSHVDAHRSSGPPQVRNRPFTHRTFRIAAIAALLAAAVLLPPSNAAASAFACAETTSIFYSADPFVFDGIDEYHLTLRREGSRLLVGMTRNGNRHLEGSCPLSNVNRIFFACDPLECALLPDFGTHRVTIDLSGGKFEPGKTRESSGISEVEIVLIGSDANKDRLTIKGGRGRDVLRLGSGGIGLNADGDADVSLGGFGFFRAEGGDGNDAINAAGGAGTGGSFPSRVDILGERGDDRLTGGRGGDSLDGGDGADSVFTRDGRKDTASGGRGRDCVTRDAVDVISGFERVPC